MIDREPGRLSMTVKMHYDDMVRQFLFRFFILCSFHINIRSMEVFF